MPIEIYPLQEPDIPSAVTCIQEAFADDPYANWIFTPETFSRDRNTASLSTRCRWGMKHALFHVAKDSSNSSGKVLGVACWLPPVNSDEPQSWRSYLGDWWLWWEQVKVSPAPLFYSSPNCPLLILILQMNLWYLGRGGLNVRRYYIWKNAQAEAQNALWTDKKGYYFCNIVTVSPDAQGKGVGKLLFNAVTRKADEEGRSCYLESSRAQPNMAIYERMGFHLAKEMLCNDSGEAITLYCMMRAPKKP